MSASSKSKAFLISTQIAKIILGLVFLVFGFNGFFNRIPMPPSTGSAGEFTFGFSLAGLSAGVQPFNTWIAGPTN